MSLANGLYHGFGGNRSKNGHIKSGKCLISLCAAGKSVLEASRVLNVIVPESQTHLLHQAGYILAIFLLLLLILIGIILTTRHCKNKGKCDIMVFNLAIFTSHLHASGLHKIKFVTFTVKDL